MEAFTVGLYETGALDGHDVERVSSVLFVELTRIGGIEF